MSGTHNLFGYKDLYPGLNLDDILKNLQNTAEAQRTQQAQQTQRAQQVQPPQTGPVCYHPSGEITEIREFNDLVNEMGSRFSEVKCEACHKVFNAQKTTQMVKLRQNNPRSPDDIVELKCVEKIYWTEIDPKKCQHINITVSKKTITDYAPVGHAVSIDSMKRPEHYAIATCKLCRCDNLAVKRRYELVYRGGKVVKEPRTGWCFI
jgi:hypothetical protein